jgi:TonB family protein
VIVRPSAWILVALLLAGCGFAPQTQPRAAVDQKKSPVQGQIQIGDFLATPDNCGMIHYARPVYPKEAKREHIEGVVKFSVVITKTGDVGELHMVSGDPVLVPAGIEAVKKWRYAPCRLNGEPVEVKTQIDVSFTLSQ